MGTRAHTVPRFYLRGFVAPESKGDRTPHLWVGLLKTGEITRRSPGKLSVIRGYYDGAGCFDDAAQSVENHLARIESAASTAIQRFTRTKIGENVPIPPEITRFLAWQAARTPGWAALEEQWANDLLLESQADLFESPPPGFDKIRAVNRTMIFENPATGERLEVIEIDEFRELRKRGWKWVLMPQDRLEALHLQAWYFQVRHFPRLSWVRLRPSDDQFFITSDRAVAWLVDGHADTPPSALRHPKAQLVAPLTCDFALVGRYGDAPLRVTPREVNRCVAFAASEWIAGPTHAAIVQALEDRAAGTAT